MNFKQAYTYIRIIILFSFTASTAVLTSCDSDPYGSHWSGEENFTICQYLELNNQKYSKCVRLLEEAKMLSPLCGYNPYGKGFTLFLPTDDAIDRFVEEHPDYSSFEELLQDTSFVYNLMRYHTVKKKLHTDQFPDGGIPDSTITGDRLSFAFYSDGDKQLIKVNNSAPIIESNIDLTNGFIHVISDVLQKPTVKGYDWLQQQGEYTILAKAIELTGIKSRLWWNKYTILAEHDSLYHRIGIYSVEDLARRIATPGLPLGNRNNAFYRFAGYHLVGGEYYLNDFEWGSKKYWTLDSRPLVIDVGQEIRINPGVDTYLAEIPETGETKVVDYVRVVWDKCNIMTSTGPVHTITDVLFYDPIPRQN